METRLPSQWLDGQVGQVAGELEEGNSLDRTVYAFLILLAIGILISRSFKWSSFVKNNVALTAVVFFALASVFWSDFPFVAFKRWFRDLGNYLILLVVLSDPQPLNAVRTLFRRLSYLLITLSVLLIKYYPQIGMQYDNWTGLAMFSGPTTSKNMLGVMCLIAGLFFFWDTMTRWPERKDGQANRIILVNVAFIVLTLLLVILSSSATSRVCLMLGCSVIAAVHSKISRRHPNVIKWLIPVCLCVYLILALCFDVNAGLAGSVGRDPTFTGRTNIWKAVLSTNTNWLIGVGYESFWLGPRLKQVWSLAGPVNEAHNGYLEAYLNQGAIGLFLLFALLVSSYRMICRRLAASSKLASLSLALWTIALFYNVTEAAFRPSFMCLTFLLGTLSIHQPTTPRLARASTFERSDFEATNCIEEIKI